MSQPDLFVVCKNCGSEVSPYVTECPYCGQRVRKRAPKLDRPGTAEEAKPRRRRRGARRRGERGGRLPRLRPDEIEGIAPDARPYGTIGLIVACLALTVLTAAGVEPTDLGAIRLGVNEETWRVFAAPFVHYDKLAYEFIALVGVGVFGSLLERRFGPPVPIAVFVLAGAAGAAVAVQLSGVSMFVNDFVFGANGAAMGLLCAWLVDDRLAARRGVERGSDLLGVAVFAAVLLLLSVPVEEANPAAAVAGAATGALLGLGLRPLARSG